MRDVAEVGRGEAEPALLGSAGQRQGECSWPEGGVGHRGRLLPCVGLGEDRTKDRVRGRHRRRMKALPGPKRGLDSIWFAR